MLFERLRGDCHECQSRLHSEFWGSLCLRQTHHQQQKCSVQFPSIKQMIWALIKTSRAPEVFDLRFPFRGDWWVYQRFAATVASENFWCVKCLETFIWILWLAFLLQTGTFRSMFLRNLVQYRKLESKGSGYYLPSFSDKFRRGMLF